jgi:hypothetical protein
MKTNLQMPKIFFKSVIIYIVICKNNDKLNFNEKIVINVTYNYGY